MGGWCIFSLLVISCAVAQDLGATDDDDVTAMLKDFDSGYDNSVKGLYANTVDKLKQSAEAWATPAQVESANQMFANVEQHSELSNVFEGLEESARRLGEGKKPLREKIPRREKTPEQPDMLGESVDTEDENSDLETQGAGVEMESADVDQRTSVERLTMPQKMNSRLHPLKPPSHPGWSTTKQYNHFILENALTHEDMSHLARWMLAHGMPTRGITQDFRNEDLKYAFALGHWKQGFLLTQKKEDDANNNQNKFFSVSDYMAQHTKMARSDQHKLEQWMLQNGTPQGPTSKASTLTFRGGDIAYAIQSHEWNGENTKFSSIIQYCKQKQNNLSKQEQHKLAVWMKMQNMVTDTRSLGEDATIVPKNIADAEVAYVKQAMHTHWRVADITYALNAAKWRSVVI